MVNLMTLFLNYRFFILLDFNQCTTGCALFFSLCCCCKYNAAKSTGFTINGINPASLDIVATILLANGNKRLGQ